MIEGSIRGFESRTLPLARSRSTKRNTPFNRPAPHLRETPPEFADHAVKRLRIESSTTVRDPRIPGSLCGSALGKNQHCAIDFRKIETIDQIVTLFVFVNFRSIGEFCVRDANYGFLNVF